LRRLADTSRSSTLSSAEPTGPWAPSTPGGPLGPRPGEQEGVDTRVKRQAIASHLFDDELEPVRLGRFAIVERIGAGAMGTVYRAHDPSLDRWVALKVLQRGTRPLIGGEALIAREAKALGRLSHPHVVAVHEIGESRGQMYVAMELVAGGNLRDWLAGNVASGPGRFAAVMELLLQAGRGLAAAHEAGIVHRDFKPANVLVGSDGRVRVADFGLAHRQSEAPTTSGASGLPPESSDRANAQPSSMIGGTPAYMAPEQWTGSVDARADQFSYCVTAWEALWHERPSVVAETLELPRGLDSHARAVGRVLLRGLTENPADRFASMTELLDALQLAARGAATQRQRRVAWSGVGIGALGSLLGLYALWGPTTAPPPCEATLLAELWDPEARKDKLAAFATAGVPYASEAQPRLIDAIDAFASGWESAYRDVCLQHRRGIVSDAAFDRRMACLARQSAAFDALGDAVDDTSPSDLPRLLAAAVELPPPSDCAGLEAPLQTRTPELAAAVARTSQRLEQARTFYFAGELARAAELAGHAIDDARTIADPPLLAEALILRGRIEILEGQTDVEGLIEATHLALATGAHVLAIEGWARRAWVLGTQEGRPSEALAGLDMIEALAEGVAHAEIERALLYNNVGGVRRALGQPELAREAFARAIELSEPFHGAGTLELEAAKTNLALITDDPRTLEGLVDTAIARRVARLGENHPFTLEARLIGGLTIPDRVRAQTRMLAACSAYDRFHPDLRDRRATCRYELGWHAMAMDDRGLARTSWREASELSSDSVESQLAQGWAVLAVANGAEDTAAAAFSAVLDELHELQEQAGAPWLERQVLEARLGLALAEGNMASLRADLITLETLFQGSPAVACRRIDVAIAAFARLEGPMPSADLDEVRIALERWRNGQGTVVAIRRALSSMSARD